MLNLFVQPAMLEQIGPRRLAKLLDGFTGDLASLNLAPPPSEPTSDDYFVKTAAFLSDTHALPTRLVQAIRTLETAAAPENDDQLDALIRRHIPYVALNRSCPLDCALELWFLVPASLECFAAPTSDVCGLAAPELPSEGGSSISDADRGTSPARSSAEPATIIECPKSSEPPTTNHGLPSTNHEPPTTDEQIKNQKSKIENDELLSLASLSPMDYDRTRKEAARSLRVRVETLDAEVTRLRNQMRDDAMLQSALATLRSPEPWPEPVNGAEVLTQVAERFSHYLFLPPGAAEALTLWDTHAHCFSAFIQSPRLNICSPEPGCGKTTALDVIASLTPRAIRTENLTAPVLFRLVHQYQPTLLLDEVDAWLPQAEELRGLLNAGHKRGACAYRCEGEGNAVRPFRAFGPAALAGIGQLSGTLHDRSIVVSLLKAEAGQIPARFDDHHIEIETELCRKLTRWTADNFAALKACDPQLPPTAFNRLADNWRPLFAIAQIAGGPWPELALSSFNHLSNPPQLLTEGKSRSEIGIRLPPPPPPSSPSGTPVGTLSTASPTSPDLLTALRDVFHASAMERMTSSQIVQALRSTAGASGMDTRHITERWLAWSLKPLGIKPRNVQVGKSRAKGYRRKDFDSASAT